MPEVIAGLSDFQENLAELTAVLQRKVLIDAAKAGGEIVREEAERNAPRRTGILAEFMTMRVSGKESDINEGVVDVGPAKSAFYGFFQEFGTAHHAPQPFLLPALEQNRDKVIQAIRDKLATAIKKAKIKMTKQASK